MQKHTFYVGQGNLTNLSVRRTTMYAYLAQEVGGFSVTPMYGGWLNNAQQVVREEAIKVEVFKNLENNGVENIAKKLREIFEQDEVWFTTEKIEVQKV